MLYSFLTGKNKITLAALLLLHIQANADCRDVIALSKINEEVVQGSSELNDSARAFCQEYASAKSSGKAMSASGSYGVLSASFGQSSVSSDQIASKYCDSSNSKNARSDAFRQYVESIAPGAFSAYERCMELSGSGLLINVSQDGVLPKYLDISAAFKSSDKLSSQIIDFTASPGVKCKWKNGIPTNPTKTLLEVNSTDVLECNRSKSDEKSTVTVFPTSKPDSTMVFAWHRFENGVPTNILTSIKNQVNKISSDYSSLTKQFQGSVIAFESNECPYGWSKYTKADGKFIRGIDNSGSNIDPDGHREPGAYQADTIQDHYHANMYANHNGGNPAVAYGGADDKNAAAKTGMVEGARVSTETRPKNISLLFCKMN